MNGNPLDDNLTHFSSFFVVIFFYVQHQIKNKTKDFDIKTNMFVLCLFMLLLVVRRLWVFLFDIGCGWGIHVDFTTRVGHNTYIFCTQGQGRTGIGCWQQTWIHFWESGDSTSPGADASKEIAIAIHPTSASTSQASSVKNGGKKG